MEAEKADLLAKARNGYGLVMHCLTNGIFVGENAKAVVAAQEFMQALMEEVEADLGEEDKAE